MRMRVSNGTPPFSFPTTLRILLRIAEGMASLHKFGLLHRDLKAANVLVVGKGSSHYEFNYPAVIVADFESSVGIVGTGFWRAPEVLLALRSSSLAAGTFTHQVDVYSYAMTCYEVITGCEPFEGHPLRDYDVVLLGERPALPVDTSPMLVDLVQSCWHQDPIRRPSFQAIQETLRGLLSSVDAQERACEFISSCTTALGAFHEEAPSDLRKFMDQRILENSQVSPFSVAITLKFMFQIALSMRNLHRQGVVHGGLKSSQIALHVIRDFPNSRPGFRPSTILVCDSVSVSRAVPSAGGVDGGLWRAPEVLKALKKNGAANPETFTAQSDVYSYAMTCYEVITGGVPFNCHRPSPSDYAAVLRGERPTFPSWLPPPVTDLIRQCWHPDPLQRPTSEVISRKLDRLIYCNLPINL